MKVNIYSLMLCLLTTGAFSQTLQITGKPIVGISGATLQSHFSQYQVYAIDTRQILSELPADNTAETFVINLDGVPEFSGTMKPSTVISPNYFARTATATGFTDSYNRPAAFTFIGADRETKAALTFADHFITGSFKVGDNIYYVEPLRYFEKGVANDLFVVYESKSVQKNIENHCAALDIEEHEAHAEDRNDSTREYCGPKTIEISVAYDQSMTTRFGSNANVTNYMLAILNASQIHWDNEFMEPLKLLLFSEYFAANVETDLFPGITKTDFLLPAFATWAQDGGFGTNAYDYGEFRSTRKMTRNGIQVYASSYQSPAANSLLCTEYRYSVFSEFSPLSDAQRKFIQSHELGHVFGLAHTVASGTDIMQPTLVSNMTDTWTTSAINTINGNLPYAPCLTNEIYDDICPSTLPQPAAFMVEFMPGFTPICHTFDPCIASLSITTNQPGLHITVTGTTVCVTTSTGFSWAVAEVYVYDHCGNRTTKYPYYWYFSSAMPFGGGGGTDRSVTGSEVAQIDIKASNDQLSIQDLSNEQQRQKEIRIFDLAGQLLERRESTDATTQINTTELPNGVFVVQVVADQRVETRKFTHFNH